MSIPTQSVNLFFISDMVKDKLTDLWGDRLLQTDFENPLCEIRQNQFQQVMSIVPVQRACSSPLPGEERHREPECARARERESAREREREREIER